MKVSFIGLGKLGLPCAEAVAKKGHTVSGYDVRQVHSDLIEVKDSIAEVVGQDIVSLLFLHPRSSL